MVGLLAIFTHIYRPEIGEFFLVNPTKTSRTGAETFHGRLGNILQDFFKSERYNEQQYL
jgi:hypothetical protein